MRPRVLWIGLLSCFLAWAGNARAEETLSDDQVHLERDEAAFDKVTEPPIESPPPPPRKKGFVLDGNLGVLGYTGAMRRVATMAPHLRVSFGYEFFKWFMLFGAGELAFATTEVGQDAPYTRAFPIYGFGAGGRFTIPLGDRLGIFAEPSLGVMKADIAHNALLILGFRDAENLSPYFLGRVGVEWYQMDRHLALGISGGARMAPGFSRNGTRADTSGMWEGGLSVRYTF